MINITEHTTAATLVYNFICRFIPFSEKEFSQFEKYWVIREFPRKYRITDIGDTEDYFNLIVQGVARKFMVSGKKEITRQLATEGESIFSEVSFVTRSPSAVIIETIEPSIFISIRHADTERLYRNMPKLEKLGRLFATDMFIKKDRRDFKNLNTTTRERFLNYIKSHPHILQRVPQKYIASYLNIKPETFSRLKHLLQKKPAD